MIERYYMMDKAGVSRAGLLRTTLGCSTIPTYLYDLWLPGEPEEYVDEETLDRLVWTPGQWGLFFTDPGTGRVMQGKWWRLKEGQGWTEHEWEYGGRKSLGEDDSSY